MFDGEEYTTIIKGSTHIPFDSRESGGYEITEYMFRKHVGAPPDHLCNNTAQLTIRADLIIAYIKKPTLEYIFELIDVDMNLPIVFEIKTWCEENLGEFNWLSGTVIKSRMSMPRSYPIFEMACETDAVAFKLRWL